MVAETTVEVRDGAQTHVQKNAKKADFVHALKLILGGPLLPLFIVLGLELFGAAMTFPIFAFFCINELKLSATSVGIIGSCFNFAQAIGSPIFGRVSDAIGRKWVLLSCFAWSSMCFAVTYFVQGFYDLLTIRTFAGFSGGSIPVASAMIMDAANASERPQVLGIKGACIGACFTMGPLVVVLLLQFELLTERRNIFALSALFCFIGFLVGCFILKETLPAEKRRAICATKQDTENEGSGILKERGDEWACITGAMVCAWIVRFFYAFATYSMFTTYSFVIKDNFGWSDKELGMMLGFAGVGEGLLGVFLYPRVDKHLGEYFVCIVGFASMAIALLLIPSKTVHIHVLGFVFFQLGQCFSEPGVINLIGFLCPSERYMGFAQGSGNGFRACASVVAPITAGILYDIEPFYTYGCAAAMVFLASIFVLAARKLGLGTEPEHGALIKGHPDESL